jgi:hypothetical protein
MRELATLSHQLLPVLRSGQEQNFRTIVTWDESWSFSERFVASSWSLTRDDLHSPPKQNVQTEKCLILIIWSRDGLHHLHAVLKGEHYNSTFFANDVVPHFQTNLFSGARRKTLKCWEVHLGNAPIHNSKRSREDLEATGAIRVPHPAESLEMAPSDFLSLVI